MVPIKRGRPAKSRSEGREEEVKGKVKKEPWNGTRKKAKLDTKLSNVTSITGVSPPMPLTKEDVKCPICWSVLIEPISMPCKHALCQECFTKHVDKTSLQCPLCRLRIGTWCRQMRKKGSLVDTQLWDRIQKEFPTLVAARRAGQDSQELDPDAFVSSLTVNGNADFSEEDEENVPVIRDGDMSYGEGDIKRELETMMQPHQQDLERQRKMEEEESERVARMYEEENERIEEEARRRRAEEEEASRRLIEEFPLAEEQNSQALEVIELEEPPVQCSSNLKESSDKETVYSFENDETDSECSQTIDVTILRFQAEYLEQMRLRAIQEVEDRKLALKMQREWNRGDVVRDEYYYTRHRGTYKDSKETATKETKSHH